jgi:hypothetical protein
MRMSNALFYTREAARENDYFFKSARHVLYFPVDFRVTSRRRLFRFLTSVQDCRTCVPGAVIFI